MESRMPQLQLSNTAVQQAYVSKSSVQAKAWQGEKSFRNLLGNSSRERTVQKEPSRETGSQPLKASGSRTEDVSEADTPQPSGIQDEVGKEPVTGDKKVDTAGEEAAAQAGVQMLQFFLMGSRLSESQQMSDTAAEALPAEGDALVAAEAIQPQAAEADVVPETDAAAQQQELSAEGILKMGSGLPEAQQASGGLREALPAEGDVLVAAEAIQPQEADVAPEEGAAALQQELPEEEPTGETAAGRQAPLGDARESKENAVLTEGMPIARQEAEGSQGREEVHASSENAEAKIQAQPGNGETEPSQAEAFREGSGQASAGQAGAGQAGVGQDSQQADTVQVRAGQDDQQAGAVQVRTEQDNQQAGTAQGSQEAGNIQRSRQSEDSQSEDSQSEDSQSEDFQEGTDTQAATGIAFRAQMFQSQVQEASGTGQTAYIRAGSSQELMDQLMDQLKARAVMGNQEFELQLQPENLGKLAIKVAYTAEKVSISIVCTNEKTMELMSSGAKGIAQIMEENLGTPTTVYVEQQEENYLDQNREQENPQHQQQESGKKKKEDPDGGQDFLQQLRLGLI